MKICKIKQRFFVMFTKLVLWIYSQSGNVSWLKLSQHDNFYLLVGFELKHFLFFVAPNLYTYSFFYQHSKCNKKSSKRPELCLQKVYCKILVLLKEAGWSSNNHQIYLKFEGKAC